LQIASARDSQSPPTAVDGLAAGTDVTVVLERVADDGRASLDRALA
jgi:hypothetical protein